MQGDEAQIIQRGALGATSNEHNREVMATEEQYAERTSVRKATNQGPKKRPKRTEC